MQKTLGLIVAVELILLGIDWARDQNPNSQRTYVYFMKFHLEKLRPTYYGLSSLLDSTSSFLISLLNSVLINVVFIINDQHK